MATILDLNAPYQALPNRGRDLVTTLAAKTANLTPSAQTPSVGSEYGGGIIVSIDPQQGYRVRMPDGAEKYLPAEVNPRLIPYIKTDGTLDLMAAVKAGITDPIDYAGWNVTSDTIKSAQTLSRASDALTRLEPYKLPSGTGYDVYKAILGGATKDDLQTAFGLSEDEYNAYAMTAPYIKYDQDNVSVDLQGVLDKLNGKNKNKIKVEQINEILDRIADKLKFSDQQRSSLKARFSKYQINDLDIERLKTMASHTTPKIKGKINEIDEQIIKGFYKPKSTDNNTKSTEDDNALIKAFEQQFGIKITYDNLHDKYTIEGEGSASNIPTDTSGQEILPDDLPEGYTQEDYDALKKQNNDNLAMQEKLRMQLEAAQKQLEAATIENQKKASGAGGAYTPTEDETKAYNELQEQVDSLKNQLNNLTDQYNTGVQLLSYITSYKRNLATGGDKATIGKYYKMSSDEFAKYVKLTDPKLSTYITGNGSFDLSQAVADGVAESKLYAMGFSNKDIDTARAYNKIMAALPNGINSYDALSIALQMGLKDELKALGYDSTDFSATENYQFLIDKGYLKPDTGTFDIGKAVADGWDGQVAAYLMQGGLTAAEAQKQINFAGKYYQNGNWDLPTALKDGIDEKVLRDFGFKQEDIDTAIEYNKFADKYYKKDGWDLPTALKDGIDEKVLRDFGFKQEDIDTAIEYNKFADKYYKKDGWDLAAALKDGIDEKTLLDVGFSKTNIEQIQAQQQALEALANYAVATDTNGKLLTDDEITVAISKGKNIQINYDLAKYLNDNSKHPATALDTLRTAGFSHDDITAAAKYNLAMATLAPYMAEKGGGIVAYIRDNESSSDKKTRAISILKDAGFSTVEINDAYNAAIQAPEFYTWAEHQLKIPNNKLYVESLSPYELQAYNEYQISKDKSKLPAELVNKLDAAGWTISSLNEEYANKYGWNNLYLSDVAKVGPYIFAPARALAPDVKLSDISGDEWLVGGIQVASYVAPFLPKGPAVGIFTAAGLANTYETAKHWNQSSTTSKILSVGVDLAFLIPIIKEASKVVRVASVKIPLENGETVTIYKGLEIGDKPVIGKSGGKLIIGGNAIEYPKPTDIKIGYEPVTKLETKIMASRNAMKKMGFSDETIARVESTLKTESTFAGKKSPFEPKIIEPEAVKTMGVDGVSAVLDETVKAGPRITEVYGSSTIKAQLAPELKNWRQPNDIDIQTNMNLEDTEAFAQKILKRLQATEGKENVRISAQSPTLIEVKVGGEWHHAVDIHSVEVIPGSEAATTGAYGYAFGQPTVKVKYPGIGDVNIMSLSESGTRKVQGILRWQKGEIKPYEHRIKDISDYYVILRTFKGQKMADEWASLWGYKPSELLKVQAENPLDIGWSFKPSATVSGKGSSALPSISLSVPDTFPKPTGISTSAWNKFKQSVESPISPSAAASKHIKNLITSPELIKNYPSSYPLSASKASPQRLSSVSVSISKPAKSAILSSVNASPNTLRTKNIIAALASESLSQSNKTTPLYTSKISAKSTALSAPTSPKLKPAYLSNKISSIPASPKIKGSKYNTKTPYTGDTSPKVGKGQASKIGSIPSSPSFALPPNFPPGNKEEKPTKDISTGKKRRAGTGKVAWKQGKLLIKGKLKPVWITVIKRSEDKGGIDKIYSFEPPEDAQILKRTPEETFYTAGKENLPKNAIIDMGAFDVKIMPDGTPKLKFRKMRI